MRKPATYFLALMLTMPISGLSSAAEIKGSGQFSLLYARVVEDHSVEERVFEEKIWTSNSNKINEGYSTLGQIAHGTVLNNPGNVRAIFVASSNNPGSAIVDGFALWAIQLQLTPEDPEGPLGGEEAIAHFDYTFSGRYTLFDTENEDQYLNYYTTALAGEFLEVSKIGSKYVARSRFTRESDGEIFLDNYELYNTDDKESEYSEAGPLVRERSVGTLETMCPDLEQGCLPGYHTTRKTVTVRMNLFEPFFIFGLFEVSDLTDALADFSHTFTLDRVRVQEGFSLYNSDGLFIRSEDGTYVLAETAEVPESGSLALLGIGLSLAAWVVARRRSQITV